MLAVEMMLRMSRAVAEEMFVLEWDVMVGRSWFQLMTMVSWHSVRRVAAGENAMMEMMGML